LAGFVDLRKENFLTWSVQCLPLFYPPLKSSQLAILIFAGTSTLKSLEKILRLDTAVGFKKAYDPGPIIGKCIRVVSPVMNRSTLTGKYTGLDVFTGSFRVHTSSISCLVEVSMFVFHF
jgi:hypothetical protein